MCVNRFRISVGAVCVFIAVGFFVPYLLSPPHVGNTTTNVTLVVTRNYGQEILCVMEFDTSLDLTAMEMLRNVTEVETRYGGLFLYGMFGLESEIMKKTDWLYYVNGVYIHKGLSGYRPKSGEIVQLDYHFWGGSAASPGFLSGYPAKLVYGVDGKKINTTIIASDDLVNVARKLAKTLEGWLGYKPRIADPSSAGEEDTEENLLILATPEDSCFYEEVQGWRKGALWPSSFEGGRIWLNGLSKGDRTEMVEGCTIQCMQFPDRGKWALMVFATDEKWMGRGLKELNEGNSIRYVASFAVTPSGIIKLPVH